MTQSEIQQLIEVVRAETQKGGNTKERIANLLTELNDAKMQRDGSNLTPEDITALQTILGSGGITSVKTDATLEGDGSESNPLGLSDDTMTLINSKTTMTAVQTYVTGLNYATNDNLTTNYVNKTTTTTQTMNALLNAPSYILGANIGTPIAWQFGRKDGKAGYSDASGVWKNFLDDSSGFSTIKINTPTLTLNSTHKNSLLLFQSNCVVTIPSGLALDFNCIGTSNTGINVSFVAGSGVTLNSQGLNLLQTGSFSILPDGTSNTFILRGGLI